MNGAMRKFKSTLLETQASQDTLMCDVTERQHDEFIFTPVPGKFRRQELLTISQFKPAGLVLNGQTFYCICDSHLLLNAEPRQNLEQQFSG